MSVAARLAEEYGHLNESQREAVSHTEGPLLVIAGPGSGKTLVLVARTLNILLRGLAEPREIMLCTFTEKAAFELRDRVSQAAKKIGYQGPVSELLVGTIHGICNDFLLQFRHRTPLGTHYDVLDEMTQLFFLFEHFNEIIGSEDDGRYLGRWQTRWTAIEGARNYFNKITEELIEPSTLIRSTDPFVSAIGRAYQAYEQKLIEYSTIDFPHQQKMFLDLLDDPEVGRTITDRVRYVMVDEYQDTNYVQEQILLRLAGQKCNICVVGDEDQALYRFRGATVRNILEFASRFADCKSVTLSVNYRSHEKIIAAYNRFMASWDWSNPTGERDFRYPKTIAPDPDKKFPDYPAVFSIWGHSRQDEARRLADLVVFLKENRLIEDESQVALLLHSVRFDHSQPYLAALAARGVKAFCPRARAYFENEEVRLMVGCFALLLGYHGEGRGGLLRGSLKALADFVDECIVELAQKAKPAESLTETLRRFAAEIQALRPGETLDRRPADYFYQFIACEPFASFVQDENRARNLAIFSQLLSIFQNYYHYAVVTARNREPLRFHFFHSFLRVLYEGGINEYEDPDQPFPKGYVQVMTIHQAKGLEFPVVIVGSLSAQLSTPKDVDGTLGQYYARPPFEPEDRITGFDRMRLHYVAFSRAENILVLTTTDRPKQHFNPIWQGLPQWPYVEKDLLKSLFFPARERAKLKKSFSFTRDVTVYETCPRQYQFFRHYEFVPARSAEVLFGTLVHQTIEDVHRWVLEGRRDHLCDEGVRELFDLNYRTLVNKGMRPLEPARQEDAFEHVINYVRQNRAEMDRVIETEVDVSVEKDDYILVGTIDLLLGGDNKLELLDFKAQKPPTRGDGRLDSYYKQLCIYAHILEERHGKRPERLLIYWTGERRKSRALMTFPYRREMVAAAAEHFDSVVACILERDFTMRSRPEDKVCRACDLRSLCASLMRAG